MAFTTRSPPEWAQTVSLEGGDGRYRDRSTEQQTVVMLTELESLEKTRFWKRRTPRSGRIRWVTMVVEAELRGWALPSWSLVTRVKERYGG